MEIWKDIEGYESMYEVSNLGNVRNIIKNELCSIFIHTSGYVCVKLKKDKKQKNKYVHRLVAQSFIENKNDLREVNHIDHNKENNNSNNLEWCTHKENMQAMFEFYGIKKAKYFCENCNIEITSKSKNCLSCSKFKMRKVERPSRETLEKEIKETSFLELGRKYTVSDNTIRKWCKYYELPYRKKDLK